MQGMNQVVAQIITKSKYQEGRGLGLKLWGIRFPILVQKKFNRFGLGYKALLEERIYAMALGQKNRKEEMK